MLLISLQRNLCKFIKIGRQVLENVRETGRVKKMRELKFNNINLYEICITIKVGRLF